MSRPCGTCGKEVTMATHVSTGKRAPLVEDQEGTFIVHDGPGPVTYEYVGKGGGLLDDGLVRYKSHYADCPDAAKWRRR